MRKKKEQIKRKKDWGLWEEPGTAQSPPGSGSHKVGRGQPMKGEGLAFCWRGGVPRARCEAVF